MLCFELGGSSDHWATEQSSRTYCVTAEKDRSSQPLSFRLKKGLDLEQMFLPRDNFKVSIESNSAIGKQS